MKIRTTIRHLLFATIAWCCALSAISLLRPATASPNSNAASAFLRTYARLQQTYKRDHGVYGSLVQLSASGLIADQDWRSAFPGYSFVTRVDNDGKNYSILAQPLDRPRWWRLVNNDPYIASDATGTLSYSWLRPTELPDYTYSP